MTKWYNLAIDEKKVLGWHRRSRGSGQQPMAGGHEDFHLSSSSSQSGGAGGGGEICVICTKQCWRGCNRNVMSRQLGPHPRAVFLDGSPWTTRLVGNNTTTTQVVEMYPLMKDPSCEYMHDWQTTFHPTCNEFHATNLADVFADKRAELLGEGWWRQGWKMTYPRTATNAILKTSQ
jgi:hypothetical protein